MKLKPLYCSWFAVVSALIASMSWATPPTIANVTARQRFPWNGLVDIDVRFLCESNDLAKVFCTFAATNNATGVAIPIGRITRNGDDSGSGSTWTRKLIWDAKADVGAVKIDDVALTVDAKPIGVQLWENGPYWAECNVGATKPEEYGHYFWWGDTVGYKRNASDNGWISVKDSTSFLFINGNCPTCGKDNSQLQSVGYIDATGNLVSAHDAATVHLGAPWRMPTDAEFVAMINHCDTEWTSRNGVSGRLVKGRGAYASKSIFLPAASYGYHSSLMNPSFFGYYWSSSPNSGASNGAWRLYFSSGDFIRGSDGRYLGQPVRPVQGFTDNALDDGGWATHLSIDCREAKVADSTHPLVYDAAWYTGGVTAKISANRKEIVSGSEGAYAWTPPSDGTILLTLNVYNTLGEVVGTENVFCLNREDLAELVVPEEAIEIGEYAFEGGQFTSVTIPSSVTKIAATAFEGCDKVTVVSMPSRFRMSTIFPSIYTKIESVSVPADETTISDSAYSGCSGLKSTVIPSGVNSIGASAFSGCVGLSEVAVPSTVKEIGENAFLNCTSLEAVSIPSSVEMLGATAFKGCAAIKTVVLERADKPLRVLFPDAYRTIENLTVNELTIEAADFFDGCESLVDVDVPEDCERYAWTFKTPKFDGDWWIENGWVLGYARETEASFVLPDELTKFGGGAFDGNEEIEEVTFGINTEVAGGFSNCPELQIVNFGGNERRIGAYAFWGDTYLDNLTIPASVEEIGKEAFLNCSYIQDLAFEGGVRDIGAGAFSNCASLISLELKDGSKRIGENAFYGCWRLMSVKLPLSLEQIGNNAFKGLRNLTGVTVPTHVKTMKEIFPDRYSSITSVVIPEGETDIIDGMFDGCSALTSIVIPNSVTNVGARAFGGCSSLVELGLPDGVRRIGASALTGCSKIKDFTLPKNLESVGDAAFSSCSLLTTMVIPETVRQIGAGIVPYSLRSLYFLGNAPVCVGNPLNGTYSGLTVYVIRGTKGWDGVETSRVLPEIWNGRAITSWTPNQFDVIFDANGGEPATYTVPEITDNSYAFPKAVPTMTGYDFAGWWTEREGGAEVKTYTKVTATKSHTLYAHWELRDDVVIVNFNANGGTITPLSKVYVVGYPFVDLPVPTRRGYRFAGWRSETGAAVSEKTIATAQMSTLVASWTANGYTVVFHSNDGADSQVSQSFAYGVETTLRRNTFTHKEHAFVGWATVADGDKVYDDADAVVNLAEVDGSVIHLYAVWIRTVVNYAVRFDGNGGGGSMDNENFTEGEVKCLTANAFVRTGFIFVGWSLTPDGEVAYEDGEEVSNLPFGTDHTLSLYAVWIAEDEFVVSKPVVNVPQGGTFDTETFLVTLSCATKGADIYYSTNGRTPRVSEQSRYGQPFEITDTTTIIAVAVRYGKLSAYTEVTITKVDPVVLTLETSLDEPKLKSVTTGGDADWTAVREEFARVGGACAKSGTVGTDQRTWLEATVSGKGELTFYWRVSCEHDERGVYSYDHLVFTAKDARKEFKIDGVTDWIQQKVTFDTEGEHAVRWEYVTDDWEEPGFADCGWVDGVVWTPSAAPTVGPTVEGDEGATVTGDAETGFVVKPSEGKTAVEVTIPGGIDAGRVTVEVSPKVASVKPNGAKVKIVSGDADITEFLNVPAADGNGVVDLAKATVKEEIVKEAMDVEKGAKVELNTADPKLTTAPTHVGLFYQLREGETLGGMKDGDSTVGDGQPWLPKITVKGGNSAFYSIGVGKVK